MSKQVAGKPEGAALLDAINDGDVEFPSRMSFMDWLKWRKTTGTRPLKKRDGVSTTLEEENKLWKEVMDGRSALRRPSVPWADPSVRGEGGTVLKRGTVHLLTETTNPWCSPIAGPLPGVCVTGLCTP